MSANFIPPIPIGQFKPSSEAIASWLYEVWKYLQENPIPTPTDVIGETERVAQTYIATNVPPMVSQMIANLSYDDFVTGTSLPIYRASNDEIGPQDLAEAWAEGCRFALVDDDSFYIMIKNGDTISLLQVLTEAQAQGVISVNGQTGVVVIPDASQSVSGLMSAADKTNLDTLNSYTNLNISDYLPAGVWTQSYHSARRIGRFLQLNISGALAAETPANTNIFTNLPAMPPGEQNFAVFTNAGGACIVTAAGGAVRTRVTVTAQFISASLLILLANA